MKELDEIRKDLMKCRTLGEMNNYISNYFDLYGKEVPELYKALVVGGIITAIGWIKPKKKNG